MVDKDVKTKVRNGYSGHDEIELRSSTTTKFVSYHYLSREPEFTEKDTLTFECTYETKDGDIQSHSCDVTCYRKVGSINA